MIELATLKLVEAGMPVKKVMKHLRQIHRQIEDKTITLNRRKNQTGVIPHAKRRNRARSYIAVPLELRQTRQRLERLLSFQQKKTKNKKKGKTNQKYNGVIPHPLVRIRKEMMLHKLCREGKRGRKMKMFPKKTIKQSFSHSVTS